MHHRGWKCPFWLQDIATAKRKRCGLCNFFLPTPERHSHFSKHQSGTCGQKPVTHNPGRGGVGERLSDCMPRTTELGVSKRKLHTGFFPQNPPGRSPLPTWIIKGPPGKWGRKKVIKKTGSDTNPQALNLEVGQTHLPPPLLFTQRAVDTPSRVDGTSLEQIFFFVLP